MRTITINANKLFFITAPPSVKRKGSLMLGFDFEVVNNDAVDLVIGFILTLAAQVASAAIAHW
jgi:hypothetical protein